MQALIGINVKVTWAKYHLQEFHSSSKTWTLDNLGFRLMLINKEKSTNFRCYFFYCKQMNFTN